MQEINSRRIISRMQTAEVDIEVYEVVQESDRRKMVPETIQEIDCQGVVPWTICGRGHRVLSMGNYVSYVMHTNHNHLALTIGKRFRFWMLFLVYLETFRLGIFF